MPTLSQCLRGLDQDHLQAVAELWGIELPASIEREAVQRLAQQILDAALVVEIVETLPSETRRALEGLQARGGRLPWAHFTRRYGVVREMGAGRRSRQQPHLNPSSISETLWYRALVVRAFYDTPTGPQEFAVIPEDLLTLIPTSHPSDRPPFGRPAAPAERAVVLPVNDHILDAACTLLAALRIGLPTEEIARVGAHWPVAPEILQALLATAGMLSKKNKLNAGAVRSFLEAERGAALAHLAGAWLQSEQFDDLRLVPYLEFDGEWQSNPLITRRNVLAFLLEIPKDTWWRISAFINEIYEREPDFQRPAGDYDSWYLRDSRTAQYLRGFEHWQAVEGALLYQFIIGPLHWLGFLDLAAPQKGASPSAFRLSAWANDLLAGNPPEGLPLENGQVLVDSKAQIHAPRLLPRAVRYQLARFCQWEEPQHDAYLYRLTPSSLELARSQDLQVKQLIALLRRHSAAPLPPNLLNALERWDEHGAQARLENVLVLRLGSPQILKELRASRAARFLGDPIGPTTVIVKPGAWEKVLAALVELGYLGQIIAGD
ncbi:MAG: helicase-associated domain-containing protein [Anaerolineae bacterium]|nr:helicase-associated domain-containing protein [Anaerolineae bacterium]